MNFVLRLIMFSEKPCTDDSTGCEGYAKNGYCDDPHQREWMHSNCRQACGLCSPTGEISK